MRDTRFDGDNNGSGHRHRLIEQGRLVVANPSFLSAVQVLNAWCVRIIGNLDATGMTDEERWVIPDSALRENLLQVGDIPPERVHALVAWRPYELAEPADPQIDWIWGTALAKASIDLAQNIYALLFAGRMVAFRPAAAESYLDGLALEFGGDQCQRLILAMRSIVDRVRSLRGCQARGDQRERFEMALATWREHVGMVNVWDTKPLEFYSVLFHEVWLLDAVRRHDRAMYLMMLNDTDNPLAIKEALEMPRVVEDFDEILSLLADAPPIETTPVPDLPAPDDATSNPRAWTHCLVAPLLLRACQATSS